MKGPELLTRVELPAGIVIEGPWIVRRRGQMVGDDTRFLVYAELDRLIETDALTGEQR
ncbi:MAG: hypothetical protein WEF86_04765 [Gemmatimonadota bacterium]